MLLKKVAKAVIVGCRQPGVHVLRPAAGYWEQNKHMLISSFRAVKILQIQPIHNEGADDAATALAVLQSLNCTDLMMTHELASPSQYFNSALHKLGCSAMKRRSVTNKVSFFRIGSFGLNDVKAVLFSAILSRRHYSTFSSNGNNDGSDNRNKKKDESLETAEQQSGVTTNCLSTGELSKLNEEMIEIYTTAQDQGLEETSEIGVFINKNVKDGEMILFVMMLDSTAPDTITIANEESIAEGFVDDKTSLVILESTDEIVLLSSKFDENEKAEEDSFIIKDIQGFIGMTDKDINESPTNQIEQEITNFLDEECNRSLKMPICVQNSYRTAAEAHEAIQVHYSEQATIHLKNVDASDTADNPQESNANVFHKDNKFVQTADRYELTDKVLDKIAKSVAYQQDKQAAVPAMATEPIFSNLFEYINGRSYAEWESLPEREDFDASLKRSFQVMNQIKEMIQKDLPTVMENKETAGVSDLTVRPPSKLDEVSQSEASIEYMALQKSLNNILDLMKIMKSKLENDLVEALAHKIDFNSSLGEIKSLINSLKDHINEAHVMSQAQIAVNTKALRKSIHNATTVLKELCDKVSLKDLNLHVLDEMPLSENKMVKKEKVAKKDVPWLERDMDPVVVEAKSSHDKTAPATDSEPKKLSLSYARSLIENMQIFNEQTKQFLENQGISEMGAPRSVLKRSKMHKRISGTIRSPEEAGIEKQRADCENKTKIAQQVLSDSRVPKEVQQEKALLPQKPLVQKGNEKSAHEEITKIPHQVVSSSTLPKEAIQEKPFVQQVVSSSRLSKEAVQEQPLVQNGIEESEEIAKIPQQIVSSSKFSKEAVQENPLVQKGVEESAREEITKIPQQVASSSKLPKEAIQQKRLVQKKSEESAREEITKQQFVSSSKLPKEAVQEKALVQKRIEESKEITKIPQKVVSSSKLPKEEIHEKPIVQKNEESAREEITKIPQQFVSSSKLPEEEIHEKSIEQKGIEGSAREEITRIPQQVVSSRLPKEAIQQQPLKQKRIEESAPEEITKQQFVSRSKSPKEEMHEKPIVQKRREESAHEEITKIPQQIVSSSKFSKEAVQEKPIERKRNEEGAREDIRKIPQQFVSSSTLPKEAIQQQPLVQKRTEESAREEITKIPQQVASSSRLPKEAIHEKPIVQKRIEESALEKITKQQFVSSSRLPKEAKQQQPLVQKRIEESALEKIAKQKFVSSSKLPKEAIHKKPIVQKRNEESAREEITKIPQQVVSSSRLPKVTANPVAAIPAVERPAVVNLKKGKEIKSNISLLKKSAETKKVAEAVPASALKVEPPKVPNKQHQQLAATQVTNVAMSKLEEALQSSKTSLLEKYVSVVESETTSPKQTTNETAKDQVEAGDETGNKVVIDKTEESQVKLNNQLQKCQDLMDIISANTKLISSANAEGSSNKINVKAKETATNPPTIDREEIKKVPLPATKLSPAEPVPAPAVSEKDSTERSATAMKNENIYEDTELELNSFQEICSTIKRNFPKSQKVIDSYKGVRWAKIESCADEAMQKQPYPGKLHDSKETNKNLETPTVTVTHSAQSNQVVDLKQTQIVPSVPETKPTDKVRCDNSDALNSNVLLEKVRLLKAKWLKVKAPTETTKPPVQTEFPLKTKIVENKFPLTNGVSEPASKDGKSDEHNPKLSDTQTRLSKEELVKPEATEKILKDALEKLPSSVGTIIPSSEISSRLQKVTPKTVLSVNKVSKKTEELKKEELTELKDKQELIQSRDKKAMQQPKHLIETKVPSKDKLVVVEKETQARQKSQSTKSESKPPLSHDTVQEVKNIAKPPRVAGKTTPKVAAQDVKSESQSHGSTAIKSQTSARIRDLLGSGINRRTDRAEASKKRDLSEKPEKPEKPSPQISIPNRIPRKEVHITPENTLLMRPKIAFKGRFAAAAKQNALDSYEEKLASADKAKVVMKPDAERSSRGMGGEKTDGKPKNLVGETQDKLYQVLKLNDRAEQPAKKVISQSAVQGLVQSKHIADNSGEKTQILSRYKDLLKKARNWEGLTSENHRAAQEIYRGSKDTDPSSVLLAQVKSRSLAKSFMAKPTLEKLQKDAASDEKKMGRGEPSLGKLRPVFLKQDTTPRPFVSRSESPSEKFQQSPLAKLSKAHNGYNRSHAMQAKPAPSLDMNEEVSWFQKMKKLTKKTVAQPEETTETPKASSSSGKTEARTSTRRSKQDEAVVHTETKPKTFTKLPFRLPVTKPKLVDLVKESGKNQRSTEIEANKNKSPMDFGISKESQAPNALENEQRSDKKEREPNEELYESAVSEKSSAVLMKSKGNITAVTFLPSGKNTKTSSEEDKEKAAVATCNKAQKEESEASNAKSSETTDSKMTDDSLAKAVRPEVGLTEKGSDIVEEKKKKIETMTSKTFNNLKKLLSQNISEGSKWPGCPDSFVPSSRSQGFSSADLIRQRNALDTKKVVQLEKPSKPKQSLKSKTQKENGLKMWKSLKNPAPKQNDLSSWSANKKRATDESACVKFKKQFINSPTEKPSKPPHFIKSSNFVYPPNKQIKANTDEARLSKDSVEQKNLMDKLTRHLRPEKKKLDLRELLNRSPSTSYLSINKVEPPRNAAQSVAAKQREKSMSNFDHRRNTVNNFAARYNFKPEKKKLSLTTLLKQSIATKSFDDDESSNKSQTTSNKILNKKK